MNTKRTQQEVEELRNEANRLTQRLSELNEKIKDSVSMSENEWPERIEDVKGRNCYIDIDGSIEEELGWDDENHFSSRETAEGMLALGQLIELHKKTDPQLCDLNSAWHIRLPFNGGWITLRFKTEKARDYFKEQHKELIKKVEMI